MHGDESWIQRIFHFKQQLQKALWVPRQLQEGSVLKTRFEKAKLHVWECSCFNVSDWWLWVRLWRGITDYLPSRKNLLIFRVNQYVRTKAPGTWWAWSSQISVRNHVVIRTGRSNRPKQDLAQNKVLKGYFFGNQLSIHTQARFRLNTEYWLLVNLITNVH